MRLAIWGLGKRGKCMVGLTSFYRPPSYELVCGFDRNPNALAGCAFYAALDVYPPTEIAQRYSEHCFDAMLLGTTSPRLADEFAEQLKRWGVPFITWDRVLEDIPVDNLDLPESPIAEQLLDQESLDLHRARIRLNFAKDDDPFVLMMAKYSYGRAYTMWDLKPPMEACNARRIVLFGCGKDAKLNAHALALCGEPLAAVCAFRKTDALEPWLQGRPVITPVELRGGEYDDCIIVVSSREDRAAILAKLRELNIPSIRVYDPSSAWRPILTGNRPLQYFDVWKPRPHEVFVDCGAYDGQSSLDFAAWTGGNYDAIYALEPLPNMQETLRKKLGGLHNLHLVPAAAWNTREELSFHMTGDPSSSRVSPDADNTETALVVQGIPLDSLVSERISFLKMDIEGSELAAINGAEQLIRTWKPRLAISLYHKAEDVFEIPERILQIVPEYRFRIRHYSAGLFETVLYGAVGNDDWL